MRSDYDLHAKVGRLSDGSKRLWYVDGKPIPAGWEDKFKQIINAIKQVQAFGLSPNRSYFISILTNNDATHQDRFFIKDDEGSIYQRSPETTVPDKDKGPVWVRLTKSSDYNQYLEVLIDYRVIDDGIIWNTTEPSITLSTDVILQSQQIKDLDIVTDTLSGPLLYKHSKYLKDERWMNCWVGAIKAVGYDLVDIQHPYQIGVFTVDDPVFKNTVSVKDANGNTYTNLSAGTYDVQEGNLTRVILYGPGGKITLMVDYGAIRSVAHLPSVLINSWDSDVFLSGSEGCNSGSREALQAFRMPIIDITKSTLRTIGITQVGEAVLSCTVEFGDVNVEDIHIQVFTRKDPSHGDSIWLSTKSKALGMWKGTASETGITTLTVSGHSFTAKMDIDFRRVTETGTIINGLPEASPR